jgi:hypothetical protein
MKQIRNKVALDLGWRTQLTDIAFISDCWLFQITILLTAQSVTMQKAITGRSFAHTSYLYWTYVRREPISSIILIRNGTSVPNYSCTWIFLFFRCLLLKFVSTETQKETERDSDMLWWTRSCFNVPRVANFKSSESIVAQYEVVFLP